MLRRIAIGSLYLLAVVLVGWTSYRTLNLLSLTTPGNVVVPFLGLAVFDGGMIVWTLYFLKGADGTAQRAVALVGAIVDLALVLGANAADIFLGGQQIATVPADFGALSLWLIVAATGINLALLWLAHVTDPAMLREMSLRAAKDKITDEAYKQLRTKAEADGARLADSLSEDMVDELHHLLGSRRPALPPVVSKNGHTERAAFAQESPAIPEIVERRIPPKGPRSPNGKE